MISYDSLFQFLVNITFLTIAILIVKRSDVDEYFKRRKYTNIMIVICIISLIAVSLMFVFNIVLGYEGIYVPWI